MKLIRCIGVTRTFARSARMYATSYSKLSDDSRKHVDELVYKMDTDHNGVVDRSELKIALMSRKELNIQDPEAAKIADIMIGDGLRNEKLKEYIAGVLLEQKKNHGEPPKSHLKQEIVDFVK
ncbi:hypothetical protein AKO1_015151 [Acrasis kona]|uniref:EF-hand domain-containing protein n=1 Tax=Acrasis kona TaxID=1008807 RepID=A0AAW2YQ58_9EUKA